MHIVHVIQISLEVHMELIQLIGNTYYFNHIVNIGLYKLDDTNCILIDTGYGGTFW